MLIASLSLVAFPYMTGFYSKDFILESAFGQFYFSSIVVYFIATIGAIFTTLYSVKVLYLTFLANPRGPLINYKQAHEGDIFMSLPAWWCGMSSVVGNKLSNSGHALKLLIPNYIRKIICGWINYSGMVISQKISEKVMGYRGSKSDFKLKSVKEQRVDGSWRKGNSLTFKVYSNGFRKKLSSQNPFLANIFKSFDINFVRNVSTLPVRQLKLHPYFVTGCGYAPSYFSIGISKSSKMKTGWKVNLQFGISLHKKDLYILELIQTFFGGVGTITSHGKTKVQYRVSSYSPQLGGGE
jgi:NADH:ubiquinone oxidoreductase subunit 5 (subunit L)/multisubunit Na+/H+ antiporter MnhA subunit